MSAALAASRPAPFPNPRVSDTKKNYELAFHINPNLDESRIEQIRSELEQEVVKLGGAISYAKAPERTRLSYEVNHHAQAYFGYIQFSTENGEELETLQEHIKLNPDIIRSIVIRLPSDAQKNQQIMRQAKARERMQKLAKPVPQTPAVPNEKLDQELEDIIEKL